MKKRKNLCRITAGLMAACFIFTQTGIAAMAEEAKGSVMRLTGTEGAVSVKSQNGKAIEIRENMKLFSGNAFETEKSSYAYISLDDTKAVKLDALSRAEIRKSGKKLELLLKSGNLFFNVTAPLKADENLNIRTSTMVTGIRGTAGYVEALNEKETKVSLLDGKVTCRGYDPADGEIKDFTIEAGQKALFRSRQDLDIAEIVIGKIAESEVPGYAAIEIKKNEELQKKITASTKLDVPFIVGWADEKLKQDVLAAGTAKDKVNQILPGRDSTQKTDPVFTKDAQNPGSAGQDTGSSDSGSGAGGSESGGSGDPGNTVDPPVPSQPPVTEVMPISIEELNRLLQLGDVILTAGDGQNHLLVDGTLNVPQGRKLMLDTGVPITVDKGVELNVYGTIEITELLTNEGSILNKVINPTANAFIAKNGIINEASGEIMNLGIMEVTGNIENHGAINTQSHMKVSGIINHLEGKIQNYGSVAGKIESSAFLEMTGGTAEYINQTQGVLNLLYGTVTNGIEIGENAEFNMSGGEIIQGIEGCALLSRGKSTLTGGSIIGDEVAIVADKGFLDLKGTAVYSEDPGRLIDLQGTVQFQYNNYPESNNGRFNVMEKENGYMASNYHYSLTDAFQNSSGEIVVAMPGDKIAPPSLIKYAAWTLDLNGQDVELQNTMKVTEGSLCIKNSKGKEEGSLFVKGENSDMVMFEVVDLHPHLYLEDVTLIQEGRGAVVNANTPSSVTITNCNISRSYRFGTNLLNFGSMSYVTIRDSSISNWTDTLDNWTNIAAVAISSNAKVQLIDSEIIQKNQTAVILDEGMLVISGESRIENNSRYTGSGQAHPTISRSNQSQGMIQFDGGIIQNKGDGGIFLDYGADYGLPETEMNTEIWGAGHTLFYRGQGYSYAAGYTPAGYTIEQTDDGYHVIPAQRNFLLKAIEPLKRTVSSNSLEEITEELTDPDATPDIQPEALPDSQPEKTPDVQPEATPDTHPVATPDSQPEKTPDVQPVATPDAQPEATPDTHPQSPSPADPAASTGGNTKENVALTGIKTDQIVKTSDPVTDKCDIPVNKIAKNITLFLVPKQIKMESILLMEEDRR